ncbi:MAG: GTPase HflX [Caldilineae bacterium]|nr:GTPase HflX [Caldilineae bacterium]
MSATVHETERGLGRGGRKETGILVGVALRGDAEGWSLEASMEELEALADSAGVRIVGRLTQQLDQANRATLVGSGKVEEIKALAAELQADVVLVDRDLTPHQQRNLERALDLKLIDRTALILDIFARHARSREGMLQVELAQMEYRLPRLTRMWTHLARQAGGRAGGGVGLRGPGETQIEIDRREIGRRISFLKAQIETLRAQRRRSRRQRKQAGLPVVAVVGYTNAGKSTLLNALSGSQIHAADQLFATLDPTTRRVTLPSGRVALFTDTVGFIQNLPTQLVSAFSATLEEVAEADLLLQVIDVTHPDAVGQAETVERVLAELGLADSPMVVAGNKVDRLGDEPTTADAGAPDEDWERLDPDDPLRGHALETLQAVIYPDLVPISARDGAGMARLLAAVESALTEQLISVRLRIPYASGEVLHRVHQHGVVGAERHDEHGSVIEARVPRYLLGGLERFVEPADGPLTQPIIDGEPSGAAG